MPVIAFRGEASLTEILDRVYLPLEPREREIASAALLRSNPQLRELGSVRPGATLIVPDIPSLADKTQPEEPGPQAALAGMLGEIVANHTERRLARAKAEEAELAEQSKLLRSAAFKRLIANDTTLQNMANDADAALGQRKKRLAEDSENSAMALRELLADLGRMGR